MIQGAIRLLHVVAALTCLGSSARAGTIGYWHFNDYDGNSRLIDADLGDGILKIDPGWLIADLADFTGTSINALGMEAAGRSLGLRDDDNNGRWLDVELSTVGFRDLELSFATRGTSTGFDSNALSFSTDGGTSFTSPVLYSPSTTGFERIGLDLSPFTALNENANVVFRFTFDGATSGNGNNRIDNLQINGTSIQSVPEPDTLLAFGLVALVVPWSRRKSKRE